MATAHDMVVHQSPAGTPSIRVDDTTTNQIESIYAFSKASNRGGRARNV